MWGCDKAVQLKTIARGKMEDYECWRVTGSLTNSMDGCPKGSAESCMTLNIGDTCPNGKEVKL